MEKVNTGWQRKQEGATTDDFTWPLQTGPELGESSQTAHKNSVKSFFFFLFRNHTFRLMGHLRSNSFTRPGILL